LESNTSLGPSTVLVSLAETPVDVDAQLPASKKRDKIRVKPDVLRSPNQTHHSYDLINRVISEEEEVGCALGVNNLTCEQPTIDEETSRF